MILYFLHILIIQFIIVCDKTEIVFKSASDAVHYLLHNSSGKSDYHCIEFV